MNARQRSLQYRCTHSSANRSQSEQGAMERSISRLSRKRATTACLPCRTRKVRCDVSLRRGEQCTNCQLDQEECIVQESRRLPSTITRGTISATKHRDNRLSSAKRPPVEDTLFESFAPSRSPLGRVSPFVNLESEHETSFSLATTRWDGNFEGVSFNSKSERFESAKSASMNKESQATADSGLKKYQGVNTAAWPFSGTSYGPLQGNRLETNKWPFVPDTTNDFPDLDFNAVDFDAVPKICQEFNSPLNLSVPYTDYPFLALESISHLSSQDIGFLKSQGCFDIPSKPILDHFIHQYFLHVHPNLPLMDEKIFWDTYMGSNQDDPKPALISLFLFQAMLFAASGFIPVSVVNRLNLSDPRQVGTTFYRRAKLLFDFECEIDPMSVAQGSLLLSHQQQGGPVRKTNIFWLGISIQNAKIARAYQYRTDTVSQLAQRKPCKRLWWCCIVRDRALALGLRVPLQITPDCFDIGVDLLTPLDLQSDIEHSKVYSSSTKRLLVDLFVGQCELAVKLTDVIMITYPINEHLPSMSEDRLDGAFATVEKCRSGLSEWFESATIRFPTPAGLGDTHSSVVLYTNLLYILFYSGRLALCHYEILLSQSTTVQGDGHKKLLKNGSCEIQDSISCVTEHTKELIQLKLTRYIPFNAMAHITLPLVLHALDVALASNASLTALKQHRLDIFLGAMKIDEPQYEGISLIRDIISKMMTCVKFENPLANSWPFISQNARGHQQPSSSFSKASNNSPVSVSGWSEMILLQPSCYLRLVLTINLSFSRGEFPDNTNFPASLQGGSSVEDVFCIPQQPIHDTSMQTNLPQETEDYNISKQTPHDIQSPPSFSAELFNQTDPALNINMDSSLEDMLATNVPDFGGQLLHYDYRSGLDTLNNGRRDGFNCDTPRQCN